MMLCRNQAYEINFVNSVNYAIKLASVSSVLLTFIQDLVVFLVCVREETDVDPCLVIVAIDTV